MIKYLKSKKTLIREKSDIENMVIEREKRKWFDEKMKLINEYETKVIAESQKAGDERELAMMDIVEAKDKRIRDLELEIIELKNSYREFKSECEDYEILAQKLNIDIKAAMLITNQLAGKFEGIHYDMGRVNKRVEKKDRKMIEERKS